MTVESSVNGVLSFWPVLLASHFFRPQHSAPQPEMSVTSVPLSQLTLSDGMRRPVSDGMLYLPSYRRTRSARDEGDWQWRRL